MGKVIIDIQNHKKVFINQYGQKIPAGKSAISYKPRVAGQESDNQGREEDSQNKETV